METDGVDPGKGIDPVSHKILREGFPLLPAFRTIENPG